MDSNCRAMDPWNTKQVWDAKVYDAMVLKNKSTWLPYGGRNAFPFTVEKEPELSSGEGWFGPCIFDICRDVSTWVEVIF